MKFDLVTGRFKYTMFFNAMYLIRYSRWLLENAFYLEKAFDRFSLEVVQ